MSLMKDTTHNGVIPRPIFRPPQMTTLRLHKETDGSNQSSALQAARIPQTSCLGIPKGNPDLSALIEIRIPPSGRTALFPFVNRKAIPLPRKCR
ncbi:hypothetical protein CDAR_609281 [Caerostris darwini]|uniref:Uncharacterized protein n=1 Tax=Caerostris darwini TaxID=1538125 RepID=A0AAV4S5I8_9ARAC|nr:hypothetical protein CDAR_609281 [Caerostris darwini]